VALRCAAGPLAVGNAVGASERRKLSDGRVLEVAHELEVSRELVGSAVPSGVGGEEAAVGSRREPVGAPPAGPFDLVLVDAVEGVAVVTARLGAHNCIRETESATAPL